jgi:hypothetical protein
MHQGYANNIECRIMQSGLTDDLIWETNLFAAQSQSAAGLKGKKK